ncbi:hypothetical protein GCM10010151_72300 [Actinoallomurus spadix]|uniref:Uncharacterized protein n=1 Tax=Actinoallomurus spadix TaxID=79912 RepID=A0ABN0XTD9_9ACTN
MARAADINDSGRASARRAPGRGKGAVSGGGADPPPLTSRRADAGPGPLTVAHITAMGRPPEGRRRAWTLSRSSRHRSSRRSWAGPRWYRR